MSEKGSVEQKKTEPYWKRLIFSKFMLGKNISHKIAYIAVMTAVSFASNLFEIKFLDNQFSFTIATAILIGIILGGGSGFAACFLADALGFLCNPSYIYMPWVGLSTGMFAFLSGLIFCAYTDEFKGSAYVKLAIISFVTFFVCTIGINSTGFYFYNKSIGFSTAVLDYVADKTGKEVTFFLYCAYRLFLKGQIWNSLFNYVLIFIIVPILNAIKPLKLSIR